MEQIDNERKAILAERKRKRQEEEEVTFREHQHVAKRSNRRTEFNNMLDNLKQELPYLKNTGETGQQWLSAKKVELLAFMNTHACGTVKDMEFLKIDASKHTKFDDYISILDPVVKQNFDSRYIAFECIL